MNYKAQQLIIEIDTLFATQDTLIQKMKESVDRRELAGQFAHWTQHTLSDLSSYSNAALYLGTEQEEFKTVLAAYNEKTLALVVQQNVERLTNLLLAKIKCQMNASEVQEINGIKLALTIWKRAQ